MEKEKEKEKEREREKEWLAAERKAQPKRAVDDSDAGVTEEPVPGAERRLTLFPSEFEESEESKEDYYCPYCSTGQKPSSVHPPEGRRSEARP